MAKVWLSMLAGVLLASVVAAVPAEATGDHERSGAVEPRLNTTQLADAQPCLTVEFGDRLSSDRLSGDTASGVTAAVPVDVPAGEYSVALTSEDRNHAPGFQPEQIREQWFLEFLDAGGNVLVATDPIGDLPEAAKTLTEDVGRYTVSGVAAVRGRHVGGGAGPNSVVAVRAELLSSRCPETPAGCPSVTFQDVRLFGKTGREPNASPLVPVKLEDGTYEVLLESADRTHGTGQETQPEEQWYLEGVDAHGKVVFVTSATDDIPDDQRTVVTEVGSIEATGVVAVRAVHAAVGPRFNSVEPVRATFRNAACTPDSGFALFGPRRLVATDVTEDEVTLVWFPGGGGSGALTYTVLFDGVEVASGLTDLTYRAAGLEVNTTYAVSVHAVDATGQVSDAAAIEVETQSAFRCTVDVVTVEIGAGEVPTDGDDVILGTDGDDQIDGLGGNDIICGLGGNDSLVGGPGNDVIEGGPGSDRVDGGEGNDLLLGQEGVDTLVGGPGNDALFGGTEADTLDGGPGDDQLYGEEGDDRLDGGDGADSLSGGPGNDTLIGGEDDDNIAGGPENDTAYGGGEDGQEVAGDDAIDGGAGDDVLEGAAGNDELLGAEGNDRLVGGPGDDRLVGGEGDDDLTGGPGADVFVEPEQDFDIGAEDTVEDAASATDSGGFFDACQAGGYLVFITGDRYQCNWPWFLFQHARSAELSFEWGVDLFFECELTPVIQPNPIDPPQCLRTISNTGLPDNVDTFTSSELVQRRFQEAYATFRSWGMSRPWDAYFAFVPPGAAWPEVTTVITFSDDTSFRSRSTRPGLIEYGADAGLTQREITADVFRQFIYGRMIPDSDVYENNRPVLDSLTEWVSNRVVNNNQPISCTLVTCSRQLALNQRTGTLLWRYMHAEAGGYGFVPRLIERLATGSSIDRALILELGLGWERDFLVSTEPAQAELDLAIQQVRPASITISWLNDSRAASYEVLVNNQLYDEVAAAAGATDDYFLEVDPETSHTVQVRALDASGRVVNRDEFAVRTPALPSSVGFAEAAQFTVALERCVELGGELYLDQAAEVEAGSALQPATEIANGCFDFGESACLDQIAASIGSEDTVGCNDDLTAALSTFDTQSVTPSIAALGSLAVVPVTQVGLGCVTQPITSPCAAWAAKNLPRSPAPVAAGSGIRVLPLLGKAGVFLVVTAVAFLAINELLDTGLACGVVFARPEGFDESNPDFTLYQNPEAMEQVTRCEDVHGASTIYGTIMSTIDSREPNFDWATEGDDWLTQQLQRVCTTADDVCNKEIGVYIPGGTTPRGEPLQQTGVHIAEALPAGPFVWHFPSYVGRRAALRDKVRAIPGAGGTGAQWYNRRWTEDFIQNNPCVPATPPGRTCDEFPFASTNQAIFTDLLPGGSRVFASLRLVPSVEQAPQRDELNSFYRNCLSSQYNVNEQFIIIAPPPSYAAAGGPSFGFRVDPAAMSVEECLS